MTNYSLSLSRSFAYRLPKCSPKLDLVKNINKKKKSFLLEVGCYDSSKKHKGYTEIQNRFGKAKELTEDKIQLAIQTYEMVDKHIRRLDSELSRLENELKEKQMTLANEECKKRGRGREKKGQSLFNPKNLIKDADLEKSKKKQKLVHETTLTSTTTNSTLLGSEVLDMPVDPNEPTYCVCHQVSYGEMIGCDNLDCPIEWFHLPCIGISYPPKGKWYCPICTESLKKKVGKKKEKV